MWVEITSAGIFKGELGRIREVGSGESYIVEFLRDHKCRSVMRDRVRILSKSEVVKKVLKG